MNVSVSHVEFPAPPTASDSAQRSRGAVFALLLGMLASGVAGYLLITLLMRYGRGWLPPREAMNGYTLLVLPLLMWVVILAHEFGHLLGGRLVGMRPLMLFAGPLHLDYSGGKAQLRFNRVASTWGGLAACAPPQALSRGGYSALVLGGPLASMALSALCAGLAAAGSGWLSGALTVPALLSGFIALVTLLPLRAGGYQSDGGQLLGLWRGDRGMQQRMAISALVAQSYGGVRPRELDSTLLRQLQRDGADAGLQVLCTTLLASHALDRGDLIQAGEHYEHLARQLRETPSTQLPVATRKALAISLVSWLALHRQDATLARAWLDYAQGGFSMPAQDAYVAATLAFAEQRLDDSRQHAAKARSLLKSMLDRGGAVALGDELDLLEQRLALLATRSDVRPAD